MELEAGKIVELHHEIKKKRPVIHCITNAVTVNDCANILLAQAHRRPWHIIRWKWKR